MLFKEMFLCAMYLCLSLPVSEMKLEMGCSLAGLAGTEKEVWKDVIRQNVALSTDTEIEGLEWLDGKESCLRVKIRYRETPEDNYRHKEDYFFFLEGGNDATQVLQVTFDGQEDLLLFLGYSGVHGTQIYAAYVWENGCYRYEPTFEKIPNYTTDMEERVIRGENTDSAASSSYFVFVYRNGKFEQVSQGTGKLVR